MTQDELDRAVSKNYVTGLERRCNELGYEATAHATDIRALHRDLVATTREWANANARIDTLVERLKIKDQHIERLMRQVARLKKKKKSKR